MIPEGYKITDQKRTQELENKGYEALKKELPDHIDVGYDGLKIIIN